MVSTTDLLGTSSFGQTRIIVNTNINALRDAYNNLETAFGISVVSGNIDVSGMSGGIIKGKQLISNTIALPTGGLPSITLNGSTGDISCTRFKAVSSITTPLLTAINIVGSSSGTATFNSPTTFNSIVVLEDGLSRGTALDLGTVTTHTVLNSDGILIFNSTSTLTLTADSSLVDGHTITLIYKGLTSGVTIPSTNLFGTLTATFSAVPYKSSITLVYNKVQDLWYTTSLVNTTLA